MSINRLEPINSNITYGYKDSKFKPKYNKDGKRVGSPPVEIKLRKKYDKRESPKGCFDWSDYNGTIII